MTVLVDEEEANSESIELVCARFLVETFDVVYFFPVKDRIHYLQMRQ
jgi:hypothetical protein